MFRTKVVLYSYCLFFTFSALVVNPQKRLPSDGGQSRLWSAQQGKENKKRKSGSTPPHPPPPRCLYCPILYILYCTILYGGNKTNQNKAQGAYNQREPKEQMMMVRGEPRDKSTRLGATQVSVRLVPAQDSFGSPTRPIGVTPEFMLYTSLYHNNFRSLVRLSLLLAMSSRVADLLFPTSGHKPPLTLRDCLDPHPSPPICQTPGRRSVRNRSTLSPSHPVLSALYPQDFRTRFALATTHRSFGWSVPAH